MYILYVGKHGNPASNDDEGAITRSLIELGHEVKVVAEHKVDRLTNLKADFLLFNHYRNPAQLGLLKIPKVFWCFDRIEWDDNSLENRNRTRREWVKQATAIADIGFMTDGDWVASDTSGKLVWLMQGFNQYLTPSARRNTPSGRNPRILLTGSRKGGTVRASFVAEMSAHYPLPNVRGAPEFVQYERGLYGKHLADAIADADIVVAPDSPITDRYWSNRLYLMLGLGAFLVHPRSKGVEEHYLNNQDLVFYDSREHIHHIISKWLEHPIARQKVAEAGQHYTITHHTYKHRCQTLITTVKERLGI